MPRCVRNFWLDAEIDGRRRHLAAGPRSKDGGFRLRILHRHHGDISPMPLCIVGRCSDGKLTLTISDGGQSVFVKETER